MAWTVIAVLLLLWLAGLLAGFTGSLVHVLLGLAVLVLALTFVGGGGRRSL